MKKYENGGEVFNKTSEELKKMSPKERRQFERQRAYNEGIKNAEKGAVKGSVSQAIDQILGPQTSGERKLRTKGYQDRKKAQEYKKKTEKKGGMKCGGKVHKMNSGGTAGKCKRDGIAVRGKTRAGK